MSYTSLGTVFNKNVVFLKENKIRLVALSFVAASVVGVVLPVASAVALPASAGTNHNNSVSSFETKTALQNVPGVLAASDQVATTADSDSAATSNVNGTVVDVPKDAVQGVTFGAEGGTLDIGLPSADQAGDAKQVAPGVVGYDSGNGSSNAVQSTEDGGVRMLTVIDTPSAPTAYDYKVSVPNGGYIYLTYDGGAVVVNRRGKLVAIVDKPWAKDAAGKTVETWFTTDSRTLVQHVSHNTRGVTFPITADPRFKWGWTGMNVYFSKSETYKIAWVAGLVATVMKQTLLTGIAGYALQDAARWATRNGYCLAVYKSHIPGTNPIPWPYRC